MEPTTKRAYTLGARGQQAAARRERVLDATYRMFRERSYDELTLQSVADVAGVSLKTVVRQFGSKEDLVLACARARRAEEARERAVAPGDVAGAVRVLADRYETLGEMTSRLLALEARIAPIATALAMARQVHQEWLANVFAAWLPRRVGRERRRRLAQLFGATEIFVWHTWRHRLGLDRADAEAAMTGTLRALVGAWDREGGD